MKIELPNVTSTIGAEAMHGNLDWNGLITHDENDFIEKAVLLYQDENFWQISQENGFNIIENRFKKELFEPNFIHKIQEISETLESYRNQNFLGQILQHHTLQSTKYLSKWIEEKNKK